MRFPAKVWRFILNVIIVLFMDPQTLAETSSSVLIQQLSHCQASLQKYSDRLEEHSKERPVQAYYDNLFQQTQTFLKGLDNASVTSSHLKQCHTYLRVVKGIVGNHAGELAPMPRYHKPGIRKLSNPMLETSAPTRRTMRKSIRYVYEEEMQKGRMDEKENEEGQNLRVAYPHSSSLKGHKSKEWKELE